MLRTFLTPDEAIEKDCSPEVNTVQPPYIAERHDSAGSLKDTTRHRAYDAARGAAIHASGALAKK
jgi:hypothetical protein